MDHLNQNYCEQPPHRAWKTLVVGNGNITLRGKDKFLHHELPAFLLEMKKLGLNPSYLSVVLQDRKEHVKNLADERFPDSIPLYLLPALKTIAPVSKMIACLCVCVKIFYLVLKHDFCYCYYPGSISRLVVVLCRMFSRPYALYLRGELNNTSQIRRDLSGAEFILATGTSIVSSILPEKTNCYEVIPMSPVFRHELPILTAHRTVAPLTGLFVGRVERDKGIYELLESIVMLKQKKITVHFVLVGAYNDTWQEELRSRNLTDDVELAGLVTDAKTLSSYYANADFFCLPTYTEGFPRVLYEAMAHGLPCITTMVGGIPSRMISEQNCLAIEARNASSIVTAVERLVRDEALRKKLAEASRTTITQWKARFAGNSHARQTVNLIDAYMNTHNKG